MSGIAAVERSLALLQQRVELLKYVSGEWQARETPLWWHPGLGVFSASRDLTSLWMLKGALGRFWWSARGLKIRLKSDSSTFGPFHIGAHLPSDAVILGPHRARGPVIVSASQGRTFKWVSKRPHLRGIFEAELSALEIGARIEGVGTVPRMISHGSFEDQADWMFTEFVPNPRPFMSPQRKLFWRISWVPWLKKEGLPFLWKYYRLAGIEYVNVPSLFTELVSEELRATPDHDLFAREAEKIGGLESVHIVRSRIHGDFSGHHVHRNKHGFTVIDWGESKLDYVFKDAFGLYWMNPDSKKPGAASFWAWLSRTSDKVPVEVEAFLSSQEEALGFTTGTDVFRSQLRSVMLYEIARRQVKRLQGRNVAERLQSADRARLMVLTRE